MVQNALDLESCECVSHFKKGFMGSSLEKFIQKNAGKLAEKIVDSLYGSSDQAPTVTRLVETVRSEGTAFLADMVSQSMEVAVQTEPVVVPETAIKKGVQTRHLKTVLGTVTYERPVFYDKATEELLFPHDELLQVCGGQIQFEMLEKMLFTATELPYEKAQELFQKLTGMRVSEGSLFNAVSRFGAEAGFEDVMPEQAVLQQAIQRFSEQFQHAHLVLGVDGAMEPLRPEEAKRKGKRGPSFWKECKGFRCFLVGQDDKGETHIEHLASWHQITDESGLGQALQQWAQRLPSHTLPVVTVADGAKWIWNHVERVFPQAVQVLDWYHLTEHLHAFANTHYKDNAAQRERWLQKTKQRLMNDEAQAVLHGLQRMSCTALTQTQRDKLLSYMENNASRMFYGTARRNGWTIGSGGMESANKSVCHQRLKISGAWWKPSRANQMLKLRCASANSTLSTLINRFAHPTTKKDL